MTLTKDWMSEDNLGKNPEAHRRRIFLKVVEEFPMILLHDARKKEVGDGWNRIKHRLNPEQIEAVQNATVEDWACAANHYCYHDEPV